VDYGPEGLGFVRLNFGTQRALLQEALERMAAALKTR
jgi:bifunctional pyridoxal-dependent enzyme with beta-cystathionase and maltose regulon repressor activities